MIKTGLIMLVLDYVYLNLFSKHFNEQVKVIQGKDITLDLIPTVMCYALLLVGIQYFILNERKTPKEAFLLGLVIYGVYEMTNKAIFDKWNYKSVAIDTIWGGTLFYLTTYLSQLYI